MSLFSTPEHCSHWLRPLALTILSYVCKGLTDKEIAAKLKERKILSYVRKGLTDREIAEKLKETGVKTGYIRNILSHEIYPFLGVRNRTEAVIAVLKRPELLSGLGEDKDDICN